MLYSQCISYEILPKKTKGKNGKSSVLGDSLSDLIYARHEAFIVAELFNAEPYIYSQATKSLVKEKLKGEKDNFDILHFSCHGKFDRNQPLKSHIVLAPPESSMNADEINAERYNLTAEEIFGLEMNANLVTLSACESGINDLRPGDELIGLTRSLIYAIHPQLLSVCGL